MLTFPLKKKVVCLFVFASMTAIVLVPITIEIFNGEQHREGCD